MTGVSDLNIIILIFVWMKSRYYIFLFFLLLAVGCRQRTVMPLLEKAESLMNNSPDSSQLLLESIESPEELPIEEYATWCLLVTQARDKNYVEHTSDSIIDIAVRYFEQKKDSLHYAKALYYKGRIYQDLKKIEEATKLFISSLNIGENINDYSLLFLITSRLGMLYARLDMPDKAMPLCQKALYYAQVIQNNSYTSYAYSYLGRVYGLQRDWEEAAHSYEQAISIATEMDDLSAKTLAMNEYISICIRADRLEDAKRLLTSLVQKEELTKGRNRYQFYLTIGDLHRYFNQPEQAAYYLEQALQSDNLLTCQGASKSLYYLYEEQKQYKKAVYYNNLYWNYTDSIAKENNRRVVIEVEAKYNKEKTENENLRLQVTNLKLFYSVFLGGLLALGIVFFMLRRLRRKEQLIQDINRQIHYLSKVIEKGKLTIENNLLKEHELLEQLEQLKEQQRHTIIQKQQLEEKEEFHRKEIEQLVEQLQISAMKISQVEEIYTSLIEKNEKLADQNQELQKIIDSLQQFSVEKSVELQSDMKSVDFWDWFMNLQKEKKHLSEDSWEKLMYFMDQSQHLFIKRLRIQYPLLKEEDIRLCILIRLKYSNEDIAAFLSIQKESVKKRKQRLKIFFKDKYQINIDNLNLFIGNF